MYIYEKTSILKIVHILPEMASADMARIVQSGHIPYSLLISNNITEALHILAQLLDLQFQHMIICRSLSYIARQKFSAYRSDTTTSFRLH